MYVIHNLLTYLSSPCDPPTTSPLKAVNIACASRFGCIWGTFKQFPAHSYKKVSNKRRKDRQLELTKWPAPSTLDTDAYLPLHAFSSTSCFTNAGLVLVVGDAKKNNLWVYKRTTKTKRKKDGMMGMEVKRRFSHVIINGTINEVNGYLETKIFH